MKTNYLILLILIFAFDIAIAQDGPFVPCVGCDKISAPPFPESGLWSNPDQSPGSGLNFEIQNGILVGYLYTYSGTGRSKWLIVSGNLIRSEVEGVVWELETRLTLVEGGSCINCEFKAADQITSGMSIRLEFLQRNYLHITVGQQFDQFFVPFIYGSVGKAYFGAQTPYIFPELGAGAHFVLVGRPAVHSDWFSLQVAISKAELSGNIQNRVVTYQMWVINPNGPIADPPPPPIGEIICQVDKVEQEPGCKIELDDISYIMPIGYFSDSRFYSEAEDGSTLEGIRIKYD